MNLKTKKGKNQVVINNSVINVVSDEELKQRIDSINTEMKAATWKDLEINRKFGKNEKLSFISDDTLIVRCDIGSETHYIRAIDSRGRELSREAFSFSNTAEGFQAAKEWVINIAARHNKKQIVLGIEPTGHYWFCIASWMIANGISVVQVNPYAVKQTKELEDNSQDKNDRKDPKLIANLVKDGNYGMPYLPEDIYAELRHLSMFRDQLNEDRIRAINRLHREMKIYFPEYMEAFGKLDSVFAQEVIKNAPFPKDIVSLGTEGLKEIWHNAKLRGRGYNRAEQIFNCAEKSVGINEGTDAGREAVKWFANSIIELEAELEKVEAELRDKCLKIPYAENILKIEGIGANILSGILAEMGDIARFDDVKEIQKLSGLGIVACSSGKHKGESKISHRGRKRLRYWLFLAAKSAVAHSEAFMSLHEYYTSRSDNPLKKMQSLVVISCKILRVIFTILRTGQKYDPDKMLRDIKRPEAVKAIAA